MGEENKFYAKSFKEKIVTLNAGNSAINVFN
jgi:hypothetical protein